METTTLIVFDRGIDRETARNYECGLCGKKTRACKQGYRACYSGGMRRDAGSGLGSDGAHEELLCACARIILYSLGMQHIRKHQVLETAEESARYLPKRLALDKREPRLPRNVPELYPHLR